MTLIVAFRLLYMPRIVVIIPFLLIVLISVPMLFVAVLVDLNNSTILYFNRVVAYVMLFLPMVAFPLLIFRRKLIANDILLGVKHSGFLMIILGCFQIIFFNVYGVDVFPYGYFYGSESRAAIFLSSGKEVFRPTALSGEPKTYGMFLVLFLAIFKFKLEHGYSSFFKWTVYSFIVLFVFMTASTSAILLLFLFILSIFITFNKSLTIYLGATFSFCSVVVLSALIITDYEFGMSNYFHDNLGESFLYDRVLVRLGGLEDFDFLTVQALKDNIVVIFTGGGWPFLNALLSTETYLPYWMDPNTIFVPKMGVLTGLSSFGLVIFPIAILLYYRILFKRVDYLSGKSLVLLSLFLPGAFLLRSYVFAGVVLFVSLVLFEALNSRSTRLN